MKKPFTQDQLISLLVSNDHKAFEYLYDNYSPAFFNIICKIIRNKEDAPDVLQDSFLKIWTQIQCFNPAKGTMFTWMVNIVRNTAIDRYRVERALAPLLEMETVTEFDVVYYKTLLHPTYTDIDLRGFVDRLPIKQKELIRLIYFEGYSHEELADSMSLPIGTIKSRVRKGLKDLRKIYQETDIALNAA